MRSRTCGTILSLWYHLLVFARIFGRVLFLQLYFLRVELADKEFAVDLKLASTIPPRRIIWIEKVSNGRRHSASAITHNIAERLYQYKKVDSTNTTIKNRKTNLFKYLLGT